MSIALVIALNLIFVSLAVVPVVGMALKAAAREARRERPVRPRGARATRPARAYGLPAAPASIR
jgi:hypothetical protein